ncbi:MAG: PD40 domain-containing protein [Candidatus Delongbacteria bacterium]|nr:PD40 domain-containing protein [Candidatus Delongbacteria bacterium]MBN2834628.1 PD40 domain-containing protein [Candidatus Delongbacteria bacterium]
MKIILSILVAVTLLFSFGKNKVQYHDFDWKYLESSHFRVFYYPENSELATTCLEYAEEAYSSIKTSFIYDIRDRIDIVLYASHNHFEETNISGSAPEESVGGFTEFFKNRVVIPYDGNWESFRHVIHHELTHAIQNKYFFNGGFQSIAAGISKMNLPLWFIEGLAEYESRNGWDRESDMYIRDAIYSNYLPSVNYLNNYMTYKGGQSLLFFISQKYGKSKIGDIIRKMSVLKSTETAFKEAIGLEFNELSEEWHRWLLDNYWPTLAKSQRPDEIAKQITDHKKYENFINNSPTLSPDGLKLAFLSNKSDYFDIYLMRTYDGKIIKKIVSGQSSGDFEEFHWLRPGICWSPDSKKIAFASKSAEQDALNIFDAETGDDIAHLKFDLDGLYSPDWSSNGYEICFAGQKNGVSNLYMYNIDTEVLTKLTNDIYSVSYPKFSPDGSKILFSSDRSGDMNIKTIDYDVDLTKIDINRSDIYCIDKDGKNIIRLTSTEDSQENYPFWISEEKIGYISNASGINNIYLHDLGNNNSYAVTNLVSGCIQSSYSSNTIVFTTLFQGGYDVYLLNDVENLKEVKAVDTNWYFVSKELPEETEVYSANAFDDQPSKITFSRDLVNKSSKTTMKEEPGSGDYKVEFSPDIITANAGFASGYGFGGQIYAQLSDKLAKHQFNILTELSSDIANSQFDFFYNYMPLRLDLGAGISHNVNYFFIDENNDDEVQDEEISKDRIFDFYFASRYGLNRYQRLDGFFSLRHIITEDLNSNDEFEYVVSNTVPLLNFGYSYDNTIWGIVGPENGTRMRLDFTYCPDSRFLTSDSENFNFQSFTFDLRKYIRIQGDYQFAVRATGGLTWGANPPSFYLGGISSWLNWDVKSRNDIGNITTRYFSSNEYPVRGKRYYEQKGNRFALVNTEFRFPLINYINLGIPPVTLGYIRGVFFSDFGSAWNDDKFRGYGFSDGRTGLNDLMHTIGIGSRVNLGIFILRYDIAWDMKWADAEDGGASDSKPKHIFSFGANF